jgi:hypothetical protein
MYEIVTIEDNATMYEIGFIIISFLYRIHPPQNVKK